MNIEEIKELIKEVSASELVQLDLEEGNIKVSLKKEGAIVRKVESKVVEKPVAATVDEIKNEAPVATADEANKEVGNAVDDKEISENSFIVKSPLVGTAYLINEETGEPFVTVGAKVKKGQTLAVVEAMKMMNDIESEVDGTIERILVEDGATVEYNGEMFAICQNI